MRLSREKWTYRSLGLLTLVICGASCTPNPNQNISVTKANAENTSSDTSAKANTEKESPNVEAVQNPGDPDLKYEMVEKDVKAYIGKRVRWECLMLGVIGEDKKKGCTNLSSGMFLVQYEGEGGIGPYWVHGTVKGNGSLEVLNTSRKKTTLKVPLLTDIEIESEKP